MGEATLVQSKLPCDSCGSSDALALYDDDHTHCFSCGLTTQAVSTSQKPSTPTKAASPDIVLDYSFVDLKKRGISEKTCRHFRYGVKGDKQYANHFDEFGNIVAQKVRTPNKDFFWFGKPSKAGLWGRHSCGDGKVLVVTEGEIDALTVYEAVGHYRVDVVSLPGGAQSASEALKEDMEFLGKYDKIVLCFDQDKPGREAAEDAVKVLPIGVAHVAKLSMKDASEMWQQGLGKELTKAIYAAEPWVPQGLYTFEDIKAKVLEPPQVGVPWCHEGLTNATYGRRRGEIYCFGAGTGIGKTDLFTQQVAFDIDQLGVKCGVIYLEQPLAETGTRLVGKVARRQFHIPDGDWTEAERVAAVEAFPRDKVVLYDSKLGTEWETIAFQIRYMAKVLGCQHIYLDHLTAITAGNRDQKEALDVIMKEMAMLVGDLEVVLHLVSHLATPEGKPHEEGGRVTIRNFRGSRAIGFWCHFMFGLERNQQEDDPSKRGVTTVRVLKDRFTGQGTGRKIYTSYDHTTGISVEVDEPRDTPFGDIDETEGY